MDKRKMITSQIFWRSGIALGLLGLVAVFLTFYTMNMEIQRHLESDVNNAAEMVANALTSTEATNRVIEHHIELSLLQASKAIAKELRGKTIEQVTVAELERLKQEWSLYGLSLFVRQGNDIVVAQSTEREVGISTKDWGYWYTAFNQLMSGQPVTVEKGYSAPNYWVGPISQSAWNHRYFKYAYYYDGTTPFMIDAFVLDSDIAHLTFEKGLTDLIDTLTRENSSIKEVTVVNVPAMIRDDPTNIVEPDQDTPVMYGSVAYAQPEDMEIYRDLQGGGERRSIDFEQNGMTLKKYYISLPEDRVLTITANLRSQQGMERQFFLILGAAFFFVLLTILFVVRSVSKRQLKPLHEFEAVLGRVAQGDLSARLDVRENNEFGWLAGQINHMTEQLEQLIAESNKRASEQIVHIAHHDDLTGLPNRKLFKDWLSKELDAAAGRDGRRMAVMFLDLDRFKNVNESLGHATGDLLLQWVARRLSDILPPGWRLARLGGDEFAMLIPDYGEASELNAMSQHILSAFEQPMLLEGLEFHMTTSIGLAVSPQDGIDTETLLKNADTAMYSAKQQGGNSFQYYAPEMNAMILEQLRLEKSLRHALENDELMVYYQPVVDLATGELVGMEALVRWLHPEQGMISPARFIPVAERNGMIVAIGQWVLNTACAQNQRWQEAGYPPIRVSVNLSPRQFEHPDLVQMIAGALEETGLDPQYLKLEITESLAMQNADRAIEKLHALKGLGIQISIDDFGTGYSSLNYLKKFPIDTLKIDQSFVGDIPSDSDDVAIVTAIIAMAHNLKIDVVAEGVETLEQLHFLQEQKCDHMQGYLFSRPVSADLFEQLLIEGKDLDAVVAS